MQTIAAAIAALDANRFEEASYLSALLPAGDKRAQLISGLAAAGQGWPDRAAEALDHAASGRGAAAHPIRDALGLLRRIGRGDRIGPLIQAALDRAPADAGLRFDLANDLYDEGLAGPALDMLDQTLTLAPDFAPARNLRAMALAAQGRTDEAIGALREIARDAPYAAAVWANLGLLLKDDGHFTEAIAAYDRALALAPDDARIRVNRVVCLLRAGLWADAWPDYEWRLSLDDRAPFRPNLLPPLSPTADLRGKTILVTHEDGFGDTLHFARYIPMLAARGARVIALVPPALRGVIAAIDGAAFVGDPDQPWPMHDFYCPFFSLPRAFGTTPQTIPAPIPYIQADPRRAAIWARRLPIAPLRIGLIWAGQARPGLPGFRILDGRRSVALADFAPLAGMPGTAFVSLQFGPEAAQTLTPPPGMRLYDGMDLVRDFDDTAAIIANLDLVISVDTAVAHLAGAMGKPVWLLDRYDHCWRWLSGRADSPWYPLMRIFRQREIGDWAPVWRELTEALTVLSGLVSGYQICVDLLKVPETVH